MPSTTSLWSRIVAAEDRAAPECRRALGELIERYWEPVYLYVRRRGRHDHSAEDLTQEFFAYVLERDLLARFDRDRGKLKTFLLAVLDHFLSDQRDHEHAAKRGGGRVVAIDPAVVEPPAPDADPRNAYLAQWARTVVRRAWERFRAADGREVDLLQAYLAEPGKRGSPAYDGLARRFGMSYQDVANALHRARGRLRESILAEIRDYVATEAEVADELRDLLAAFANR